MMIRTKEAFTLAEVLITLTIIGVIAAITIPNLMQSYRKHTVEVKLKDVYSVLDNALKVSISENGSPDEWGIYWSSEKIKDIAENKLIPYLKVGKNCKEARNSDCFKPVTDLDGETYSVSYGFVLANGIALGITVQSQSFAMIHVDIDGPQKGKSELGRDVFVFSIIGNADRAVKFSPGAYYSPGASNLYVTKNVNALLNTVAGACSAGHNQNSFRSGFQCSAAIAKNGWKIPDDYPIKKF